MDHAFRKLVLLWRRLTFGNGFWRSRGALVSSVLLIAVALTLAAYGFFHSAPPDTIIITAGPQGSIFQRNAERYRKILERNGVKLRILSSEGALENLKRLNDPAFRVDVGLVQGGVGSGVDLSRLVSLGSVSYEPLLVFYRAETPVAFLSGFAGKRLAIGPEGSGTRQLALALLKANGIEPGGATTLLDLDSDQAAADLLAGNVDGIFLMGDSANPANIRKLLRAPGIRLYDFTQAAAYTRRIPYLNKLVLPEGSIDFGHDIPAADISLIAPTVELVARDGLNPALSDLLLEAAQEVHGRATLFQRAGEFPAPMEHEFRISDDASRYYKSGKSFLYRNLPFWLASLANRLLVVVLPIVVLLIPGLRLIPSIYGWHMRSRILRWYGALLALEREVIEGLGTDSRDRLLKRLDAIEHGVSRLKVPVSFGDQFYVLREHINFVRERIRHMGFAPKSSSPPDDQ
jgi:TRAP-type uncharacterized transport system substrate-binding protein